MSVETIDAGEIMGDLSANDLQRFFATVGARLTQPASIHILGGSALVLLGRSRRTLDLDFAGSDLPSGERGELRERLEQGAAEMKVAIEPIPFEQFVPLPSDAATRHRYVGQFGKLTVYVFDPYSIALSKVERGFKTDIDDVVFMLRHRIIALSALETCVNAAIPRAREFDIDPDRMRTHLEVVAREISPGFFRRILKAIHGQRPSD
jgi:hypothetical protein